MDNKYISPAQFAERHGLGEGWVWALLREGRIPGAVKVVDRWLIPADAQPPARKQRVQPTCPAGYEKSETTAARWGVTSGLVRRFCTQERIPGAVNQAGRWLIPAGAAKPDALKRGRRHG